MQISEIHNQIKQNTKHLHDKLELMEIPRKIYDLSLSPQEYTYYLIVFTYIHRFVEGEFLRFQEEWGAYDFAIEKYLRGDLLQKDLAIMADNLEINKELYNDLPTKTIDSFAQAVGYLYVLTGSTMGGKILSKKIEENFAGTKFAQANNYFNAFNEETNARWFAYLEFLSKYAQNHEDNPQVNNELTLGVTKCYELIMDGFDALTK